MYGMFALFSLNSCTYSLQLYRMLLLQLVTLNDTYTIGRTGRLWTRVRVVAQISACTKHRVNNNPKSQKTSDRRLTP
jgi:hypothetical protein